MLAQNIIPILTSVVVKGAEGTTNHSVSAFGSSIGTLTGGSI